MHLLGIFNISIVLFTARHTTNVWPETKKHCVDTGKMKFVFHDFPVIRIHKEAALAAQAANCAGDQDRYWDMHDRLFEHPKAIKPVAGHAEALASICASPRRLTLSNYRELQTFCMFLIGIETMGNVVRSAM